MPLKALHPLHKLAFFSASVFAYAVVYYMIVGYDDFYFRRDSTSHSPKNEAEKFLHLLFFSAVTQSTVGYGDTYPRTLIGKMVVMTQIFVPFVIITL